MTDAERAEFDQLKSIVECLMIVHEGIQELDGTTTELYNAANSRLKYKTHMLKNRKQMEKEKAEVQSIVITERELRRGETHIKRDKSEIR